MCGRYYIDDETAREIERIIKEVDKKLQSNVSFKASNIHPFNTAPVIIGNDNKLSVSHQRWGFKGYNNNIVFNARSETVLEKKMFRNSVLNRRCIIPANWFYEWDSHKTKYAFKGTNAILFMAGFYGSFSGEERFVIITTAANSSMVKIHDRMPLLLDKSEISNWILDDTKFSALLSNTPHSLERSTDYEQQVLPLDII